EEERAVVVRRVAAAGVEGHAADRRTAGAAVVPRRDGVGMVPGKQGLQDGAGVVVEKVAHVQVGGLEARLDGGALVAGPAEVQDTGRRIRDPVDLLPVVPPDVADPDLVRSRSDRQAKRIPEAVPDDPILTRDREPREWIVGRRLAGDRVDAQDLATKGRSA